MKGMEKKTNNMLCSLIKVCVVSWELRWKGTKIKSAGGGGAGGWRGRAGRFRGGAGGFRLRTQAECGWASDFSSKKIPWLEELQTWKQYLQMLKCLRRHCCGEIADITQCVQPNMVCGPERSCVSLSGKSLGSGISTELTPDPAAR